MHTHAHAHAYTPVEVTHNHAHVSLVLLLPGCFRCSASRDSAHASSVTTFHVFHVCSQAHTFPPPLHIHVFLALTPVLSAVTLSCAPTDCWSREPSASQPARRVCGQPPSACILHVCVCMRVLGRVCGVRATHVLAIVPECVRSCILMYLRVCCGCTLSTFKCVRVSECVYVCVCV